jgi:hypothetical protein
VTNDGHRPLSNPACKAGIWRGKTMFVTNILAVYRGYTVMIVAETEEGVLLELSLKELADIYELLPPALWQVLVQHYQIFYVS